MDGFLDQVKRVESADGVPDGEYEGTRSGYTVKFETPCGTYEGNSTVGVRGVNVPCVVKVECGRFKVMDSNRLTETNDAELPDGQGSASSKGPGSIPNAIDTLTHHIGCYGDRIDQEVSICWGNGVIVRVNGVMQAGGIPNVSRWIAERSKQV